MGAIHRPIYLRMLTKNRANNINFVADSKSIGQSLLHRNRLRAITCHIHPYSRGFASGSGCSAQVSASATQSQSQSQAHQSHSPHLKQFGVAFDSSFSIGKGADGEVYKCSHTNRLQRHGSGNGTVTRSLSTVSSTVPIPVPTLLSSDEAQVVPNTNAQVSHVCVKVKLCEQGDAFSESSILHLLQNKDSNDVGKSGSENILRLYGTVHNEDNDATYIITEYCAGGDLFAVIAGQFRFGTFVPFEESKAARYIKDILTGLKYCHAHNVAHLDVKPENILLRYDGNEEPKMVIADFGAAHMLCRKNTNTVDELRVLRRKVGTNGYCAPELQKGMFCAKSDVYGVGVVLHLMLFGSFPKTEVEPNFSNSTNPLIARLLKGMLAPNVAERLSVDECLESAFFNM